MLDLDRAREVVARREQERVDALVREEAANEEHRRMMAATSQTMAASLQHNREQRIAAHEQARTAARAARDRRDVLRTQRQEVERKVGASRADLAEMQKQAARCVAPSPDDFPTAVELDAWKQRRGMLDDEARAIAARIGSEATELRAAQVAEDDAQAELERLAGEEMRLRS